MAEQVELEITPRDVMGKATKRLRKSGIIPANISGHKEESMAVQLDEVAFDRLHRSHGARNIIRLRLPNAPYQTALVRRVQRDPRTGKLLHIDFSRVSMSEKVTMRAPLRYVGESPAVKDFQGVLLHLLDALEVECTASDIVEGLDVDISPLVEMESVLHAKDVKLPKNFTLLTDPEEPIVKVAAPKVEAAEVAEEEAAGETAAAPPTEEE